ncbi:MAG: DUF3601 domain-containing protein [Ginsengibacter sp.]
MKGFVNTNTRTSHKLFHCLKFMSNSLNLMPGQKYKVIKTFVDFDHLTHPIGETWTFVETNFLPYESGLTLHVLQEDLPAVYRLRWTHEDQAEIVSHFMDYVEQC